jgi:hypothetical protein
MATADRVMLVLDYQNALNTARTCFHQKGDPPQLGHVWPVALGELIVARRPRPSTLDQVRIYRGLPASNREPTLYAVNERQATAWSGDPRVEVIRRPLRYPRDWPTRPAQEKGIDVALAVDLIRLAVEGAYDVAVVFSRDTDLILALEAIRDMSSVHVHLEVATWQGASRLRFPNTNLPWVPQPHRRRLPSGPGHHRLPQRQPSVDPSPLIIWWQSIASPTGRCVGSDRDGVCAVGRAGGEPVEVGFERLRRECQSLGEIAIATEAESFDGELHRDHPVGERRRRLFRAEAVALGQRGEIGIEPTTCGLGIGQSSSVECVAVRDVRSCQALLVSTVRRVRSRPRRCLELLGQKLGQPRSASVLVMRPAGTARWRSEKV